MREGPSVVHCSAGIGRTGTFIALDRLLDEARESRIVNVFKCAKQLRTQRVNMIQTLVRYRRILCVFFINQFANVLSADMNSI